MTVRSMTGYGRGGATSGGLRVEVEISSVNRKQLDVVVNLPKPLNLLESRVQDEIARVLSRGRVTVDIAVQESARVRQQAIRVDHDLAAAYLRVLRRTARRLGLTDDLDARILLNLPGVLHYEPLDEDVERIWPVLSRALRLALRGLLAMRVREGRALARDLQKRVGLLGRHVTQIERLAPGVMARYREALASRLQQAGFAEALADERIQRELLLFADRSDITEEVTRLRSHLAQAGQILQSAEPAGRPLDFLAQEMNREINTVGSKANDAAIARYVVHAKADLERLREQVQNIE